MNTNSGLHHSAGREHHFESVAIKPESMQHTSPLAAVNPLAELLEVQEVFVKVEGLSASWSYEREKLVLNDISFEVNKVCQDNCDGLIVVCFVIMFSVVLFSEHALSGCCWSSGSWKSKS